MRRRTALSLVFLLSLILTPRPAHAWLGWLDNLSGPGKFGGLLYEFRGVCFGPEMSYEVARQAIAARRQLKIVDVIPNRATGTSRAQAVLSELDVELRKLKTTFPLYWDADLESYANAVSTALLQAATLTTQVLLLPPDAFAALVAAVTNPDRVAPDNLTFSPRVVLDSAVGNPDGEDPLEAIARVFRAVSSTGVYVSFCDTRTERQSSIDFGYYHLTAAPRPQWANNQAVHLDTAMVFFSHRLFRESTYDVADVALGAGAYWLTSSGLNGFRGVILQPIRADFHAPTKWSSLSTKGSARNKLLRAAAIPSFRLGLMMFPAGFDAAAFGPADSKIRPGELVPTWGFFLNLQPILTRLR